MDLTHSQLERAWEAADARAGALETASGENPDDLTLRHEAAVARRRERTLWLAKTDL